ncbi:TIGR02677 family protein [Knoellia aerolata]|nr:TIGR02677 family protein [Knoellia aerolata]
MSQPSGTAPVDRVRLEALRYAVNDEAVQYVAIMRQFTSGLSGLLSDQSAAEVTTRLSEDGIELDDDTVEARLSYLVEHGNLARSPRETEARSLADYLRNRARYQLTQRGELVHRQVEELLGHSESAREVSSEMLGGILAGLTTLSRHDRDSIGRADPEALARDIGTVFAQFDRLVHSTREFYAYLTQVLTRYDLDRDEFQAFKTALVDYLQRFVDEVQRHMPQIADTYASVAPLIPALCERANSGQRLLDLDGTTARRATGLSPEDWPSLHAWFAGGGGRSSDADVVRQLATQAMRSLLANLRRIASSADREHGRYADLVRLAGWFDTSADDAAHALWATAFGLHPCRHLSFVADDPERPVSPTTSWWVAPSAEVPLMLRRSGLRSVHGRPSRTVDYSAAKAARVSERAESERGRAAALAELASLRGRIDGVRLSEAARTELLEVYAACLAQGGGSPSAQGPLTAPIPHSDHELVIEDAPGERSVLHGPSGRLEFVDRALSVRRVGEASGEASGAPTAAREVSRVGGAS